MARRVGRVAERLLTVGSPDDVDLRVVVNVVLLGRR